MNQYNLQIYTFSITLYWHFLRTKICLALAILVFILVLKYSLSYTGSLPNPFYIILVASFFFLNCLMMMMNRFCLMVDRRKAFNLISSRDRCQRFSPSRISDMPRVGFEPAQNLSSG